MCVFFIPVSRRCCNLRVAATDCTKRRSGRASLPGNVVSLSVPTSKTLRRQRQRQRPSHYLSSIPPFPSPPTAGGGGGVVQPNHHRETFCPKVK
ncbi:hypothetical protein CKAH01_05081 [Colletotrichum kahawae]|uniref:Uncharacterized protein n=1 Tax=Colletotrichum kahawae TaxID=34407 RepID=A0AAD9YI60_COLKA|nr:hypothetical protein CKAH01_05081 [Colletotrichum kahawae]